MVPARVLLLVLMTCVLVPGCSGTTPRPATQSPSASPDQADASCRDTWSSLGQRWEAYGQGQTPSDLRSRWTSVLATIDYYAHTAKASDCDAPLTGQKQSAARIRGFTAQLRRYDAPYRLAQVRDAAVGYLSHPKKQPPRQLVRRALTVATRTAPRAVTDMQDGWDETESVDLANPAARARALSDLRFLAGDSLPFQQFSAALKVLARTRTAS